MGRKDDMVARLARVQGQVRGLSTMIEDDREALEVITLIAAIRSALDGVGTLVLTRQLTETLTEAQAQGLSREQALERTEEIRKSLARFVR